MRAVIAILICVFIGACSPSGNKGTGEPGKGGMTNGTENTGTGMNK